MSKKITQLDEATTVADADVLPIVVDTSGTPITKKIQASNLIPAASATVAGKAELATAAETTTGTDSEKVVTPDGLAGSGYGKRIVFWRIIRSDTPLTTGDGKDIFHVPSDLNGWNLVDFDIAVDTPSSSGLPTAMLHNLTDAADMLSTAATIDVSGYDSYGATTPPVIDAAHDDVATGDRLRADVDNEGTDTQGLVFIMVFQKP
jgi:hypothetical protein